MLPRSYFEYHKWTLASAHNRVLRPLPVYEATFADGSTLRMTFYTDRSKPIDFDAGRRLCEAAATPRKVPLQWTRDARGILRLEPVPFFIVKATNGYVIHDGISTRDPRFIEKHSSANQNERGTAPRRARARPGPAKLTAVDSAARTSIAGKRFWIKVRGRLERVQVQR